MENSTNLPGGYEEQARRLHERLQRERWPQPYMFKFIMPNDRATIDKVLETLPRDGEPRFSNSRNGKYTCITCVVPMPSAEAVMEVTTKACGIDGVISL